MDENTDLQFARIDKILAESGEKDDWESNKNCYYEYLKKSLEFPINKNRCHDK